MATARALCILAAALLNAVFARDIVQIATTDPSLTTLAALLTKANLVKTLSGAGPFTLFAPLNEGFAAVPPDILKRIYNKTGELRDILLYHALPGNVQSNQITNGESIPSLFPLSPGNNLTFNIFDQLILINEDAR